jgi:hypothetical protein
MWYVRDIRGFNYVHHFMPGMQGQHVRYVFHVLIIPFVSSVLFVTAVLLTIPGP